MQPDPRLFCMLIISSKATQKYSSITRFSTTVEDVQNLPQGGVRLLLRRENANGTDTWSEEDFDHLVVATGHNSVPHVPKIPGLETWKGGLQHASTWRSGHEFKNKSIFVIGTSESAIDLVLQSLPHVKGDIHVCQRTHHPRYPNVFDRPGVKLVTTIDRFTENTIHLHDGSVLRGIDVVVFATGYFYTYPFLSSIRPPVGPGGHRVPGLYQHIFDIHNPNTIAFVGVVNASLTWLTWEKSAFLVALFWSGRIKLPSREAQEAWEADRLAEKGEDMFHVLELPYERVLFFDQLNELATEYLQQESADETLLRGFPFEFILALIAGRPAKLRARGAPKTEVASSVTEAITTSSGIVIPTGRSIILQVNLNNDNGRRSINRRALGGFVSPVGTDTCTFASTFNLAEDQLFSNDFPIYYTSGEDYKELLGVDTPPSDSISTGFIISSGSLVFRNAGLPNGEAGFCQTSDGRVYAVFTDGPPQCVPLVGVGETTIASDTTTSQVVSSGSDTLITVSQTEDSPASTATTSDALPPSSRVTQSESVDLQTSDNEISSELSSSTIEASALFSSAATAAPVTEASTTNIRATTGTDDAFSTDSVSTGIASSGIASRSSLELSESSVTSTVIEEIDSTSTVIETSNIESSVTRDTASETQSDIITITADTTSTEATTTADTTSETEAETSLTTFDTTASESITTENITTENITTETFSTDITTAEEDTTTSFSDITTTEEANTTTNEMVTTTTSEQATTTTENLLPHEDCFDVEPEYTAPNGDRFDLFCRQDIIGVKDNGA
ncbi:thiol-specific monooxygenase [Fusarium napiforme]|uniref:Thiol-specific monooxygenase n=1 Tax=Fusarium napiforme TaxID=42672 RepID=A0A8H5JJF0_9HYPO|nr:thiol-specific monooxygenase [Fusarium napiforme]